VLDNLKVHKSKKLDEIYDTDFKEMLLPPYSCALNPIERLWSLVKRQWQKSSHQFTQMLFEQSNDDATVAPLMALEKLSAIMSNVRGLNLFSESKSKQNQKSSGVPLLGHDRGPGGPVRVSNPLFHGGCVIHSLATHLPCFFEAAPDSARVMFMNDDCIEEELPICW
jgi:hypothetical protein